MGIEHHICERCNQYMDKNASVADPPKVCPHCGARQSVEKNKSIFKSFIIALIIMALIYLWRFFADEFHKTFKLVPIS